jgi:hypothetical protein
MSMPSRPTLAGKFTLLTLTLF